MIQRVIMGTPSHVIADCPDATPREIFLVAPLVILIVAVGLNWNLLLQYTDPAARTLVKLMGA
jgi:NADH:ubiquinone oxidoreductase subunit 4 (subunit M)